MDGHLHTHTQKVARRDAAIRRLRTVNRSLIGLALLSGAVLTEVAAHAFPGRTITTVAGTTTTVAGSTASVRVAKHRRRTHKTVAALTPPASPPASAPSAPAPAPVTVAPAPVASGGS